MGTTGRGGQIELFASRGGVHAVKSPVRVAILEMLADGEMPFDTIVERTGRAKSTVSVHLRDMVEEGILGERPDPADARRKIFFIAADHLGALSAVDRIPEELARYAVEYNEGDGDPFAFYRLMFRTLRTMLMQTGVNLDPVLFEAGRKVGEAVAPALTDQNAGDFLGKVACFWEEHRLGRVEAGPAAPFEVFVYDCFECADLPRIGRPACSFDTGILTTVFSAQFGREMEVTETHCYAAGDPYCRFVIREAGPKK
ncbi:V4R domain-containing protein [Methanofollis ethanolicus]|uniref:V4R domain-containing protein n=1 Tax=Methanofollis ethanolicus TaxID=488124 RepID=UPI000830592D|nr:V4R domain-containing protein [Methanofollis ethanolicus]